MVTTHRKNGLILGRKADGKFGPGNPDGPKGACQRTVLAPQAVLVGEAEGPPEEGGRSGPEARHEGERHV